MNQCKYILSIIAFSLIFIQCNAQNGLNISSPSIVPLKKVKVKQHVVQPYSQIQTVKSQFDFIGNLNFNAPLPTRAENEAMRLGYQHLISENEDVGIDCHNDMVRYFKREAEYEKENSENANVF